MERKSAESTVPRPQARAGAAGPSYVLSTGTFCALAKPAGAIRFENCDSNLARPA